ncbi:MAG: tetratricopeptide repeat protein [Candidatus Krumholzibacteriota bacterium]|nr:tetratricopeptide repeat protein [Candidatus Krumholzibacteriota bacterium]
MKRMFYAIILALLVSSPSLSGEKIDGNGMLFYMKGSFFEARNDLMHAYTYYLQADRYQPDNAVVILALARVTFEIEKYDETLHYAEKLLDLGLSNGEAKLIIAEVELRKGNHDKALELFEKIKDETGVPRLEVRKLMARIYLEKLNTGKALQILEEAQAIDSQDFYINYRLGFLYADENRIDKAIGSFRKAIDLNPDFPNTHLALSAMLLQKGENEEAKLSLRNAIELEPGNRTAIRDLAELYYEDGELAEGIALLEPLLIEKDLDREGKATLGKFYYKYEEYDKALAVFKGLLESEGINPSILRVIAEIEIGKGNFRSGVEYLKKLLELEPADFDNYIGLLLIAFDFAGDPSCAEESSDLSEQEGRMYLNKAVSLLDRDSADENYFIGMIYRRLEEYDKASEYLLRAKELGPEDDTILLELAQLFLHYERYDEAIEIASLLYEKSPGEASLLNFYGYLLAEAGERLEFAEQLLTDALKIEPDNGYFLDSMGWIKYRQEQYHKALEVMLEAVARVDDDPIIWEHIGDIYVKLGMYSSAKEAYSKSIDIDSGNSDVRQKLSEVNEALPGAEK